MNGVYFLLLGLFWSLSFLGIKVTVISLAPGVGAFLRVLIAQIVFTGIFFAMRDRLRVPFQSMWRLWVIGVFTQGLPFFLLFTGECYITPALASIINSSVAAWALLFSIFIFKDYSQATWAKIMGLCLGLLGVVIIFWPDLAHQQNHNKLFGVLAVVGMAMSYGLGSILNQRFNKSQYKTSFKSCLWQQHWGSLFFLLIMVSCFEKWPHFMPILHNTHLMLALVYLGVFSTAIAWLMYIHLVHIWGAVRTGSVMLIVPILAIIWDKLFLNLPPSR
ncbi:MAG: DMT family transporter [Gammaproteobacteria bacterium]|nr:DMT family transporter [Gammaproteobacteria bacterium]